MCSDLRPARCSLCACALTHCMRVWVAWHLPLGVASKRELILRCVNTSHLRCFVYDSAGCRGVRHCRCAGVAMVCLGVRCGCVLVCAPVVGLCSDLHPAWCSLCACVLIHVMWVGGAWRSPVAAAGKHERTLRCVNASHLCFFVCDSAGCRGVRPCRCAGVAVLC